MPVYKSGVSAVKRNAQGEDFRRQKLNLVEGTNTTLVMTDNPTTQQVDVTINSNPPSDNITGQGVANQVAFYTSPSVISGNDLFVWDNTYNRLGIGTDRPQFRLELKNGEFAFSDTDVNHGMTLVVPTNVFAKLSPISGLDGGLALSGLSDTDATGLAFTGTIGIDNPTDTVPAIKFVSSKKNGNNLQAIGTNETALNIENWGAPNTVLVSVLGGGNVGIGTTSPGFPLEVVASSNASTVMRTAATNGNILIRRSGGTVTSQTTVADGDLIGIMGFQGYDGTNYLNAASMRATIDGTVGTNDLPTRLGFFTTPDAGSTSLERMTIKADGNVGIGTTAPLLRLHIEGGSANAAGILLHNTASGADVKRARLYSSGGLFILDAPNDTFSGVTASNIIVANLSNGNVGIGKSPSYRLEVSTDSAAKPSTNTWTISSDSRLKKDIVAFTEGLAVLKQINPISYKYNGKAGTPLDAPGIGVEADKLATLLPHSVGTFKAKLNPTDTVETTLYNFNTHALTYIMLNAVKELSADVEAIKTKLGL